MGAKPPKPDPLIGQSAVLSAETGQSMLKFMQGQADVTNAWAAQDRNRYKTVFEPQEDRLIAEANTWDSAGRVAQREDQASGDVMTAAANARGANERAAASMGVDPSSGRFMTAQAGTGLDTALGAAGARNLARRSVEQEAEARRASVVNMGRGLAVNPGTSMGLSNGAAQAGFGGAMSGYQQQGSLLNMDYGNRMQAYNSKQGGLSSLFGGLGSIAGAFGPSLLAMSSKEYKENGEEIDALGAVRAMPVEQWKYKDGIADGGTHIGPYAEDFQAATGLGDGKSIDMISAVGVSLGAVQQIDKKLQKLTAMVEAMGAVPPQMQMAA